MIKDSINIEGNQIIYEVTGVGQPIILLHGWRNDRTILRSIQSYLGSKFKVYNLDIPGFGESSKPVNNNGWEVEDFTEILERFTKLLDIKNPIIISHGFGGKIGVKFAGRNSTKALILIDVPLFKPHRNFSYYLKIFRYKTLEFAMRFFLGKKKVEKKMLSIRERNKSGSCVQISEWERNTLKKIINTDFTPELKSIQSPTLIIHGENCVWLLTKEATKTKSLLKQADLVILQEAGNFCFIEYPKEVEIAITSFLDNLGHEYPPKKVH